MKNRIKDEIKNSIVVRYQIIFSNYLLCVAIQRNPVVNLSYFQAYFRKYITSLASFTVLGTSGKAAATRFGA